MFRYCLIGSLVFHIIVLLGVGFCLPRYTASGSSERYFQVTALTAHVVENEIRAESSPHKLKLRPKNLAGSKPEPIPPVNNIGSRNDALSIETWNRRQKRPTLSVPSLFPKEGLGIRIIRPPNPKVVL